MLEVPVYNTTGEKTGTISVDPEALGGHVRYHLLKQAIVRAQANARQNTSQTRSRGQVTGSTRKLYRQKGTGNARMGANRTCIRRGGGVAFAKGRQTYKQAMPRKMRRLALNNAILAKIEANDVLVIEGMAFETPRTKAFVSMLQAVGVTKGCVVALDQPDRNVYLSARNLQKTDVGQVTDLHAYQILCRDRLVMTREALASVVGGAAGGQ